jgi:hypothetical protein
MGEHGCRGEPARILSTVRSCLASSNRRAKLAREHRVAMPARRVLERGRSLYIEGIVAIVFGDILSLPPKESRESIEGIDGIIAADLMPLDRQ